MKKTRSLSFLTTLWTALGIGASMAIYALFQMFFNPELTVGELAVRHLWHTFVFGAVIYGISWLVFRRTLVNPVRKIQRHLYAVGTGRIEKLELPSAVEEVRAIVDGVNLMILRMEKGDPLALEENELDLEEVPPELRVGS